jgi:hypothetical protein
MRDRVSGDVCFRPSDRDLFKFLFAPPERRFHSGAFGSIDILLPMEQGALVGRCDWSTTFAAEGIGGISTLSTVRFTDCDFGFATKSYR